LKLKVKGTNVQKAKQYPSIGDQLDALWKILKHNNTSIPDEALDVFNSIQGTKKELKRLRFTGE